MLTKNDDDLSSKNEVIAENISTFLQSSKKKFSIKDGRCPSQFMFDANHFHIETTLDTTNSEKLSKLYCLLLQTNI